MLAIESHSKAAFLPKVHPTFGLQLPREPAFSGLDKPLLRMEPFLLKVATGEWVNVLRFGVHTCRTFGQASEISEQ